MINRIDVGGASFVRGIMLGAWVLNFWSSPAEAQRATPNSVRGRVLGPDTVPVAGALVELVRRRDSVRTAGSGEFHFRSVSAGPEVLRIRAIGYKPMSVELQVSADSGWANDVVLERVVQELPDVQVRATAKPAEFANTTKYDAYFRRRQSGQGTFRTREELEEQGATDLVSVLQGIPGVSATLTLNRDNEQELRLRIARCPGSPPRIAVYLDGSRIGFPRQTTGVDLAEVLTSIPFHRVRFVEFYRGVSQIPSDLDRGDYCAVIVIWTG